MAVWHKNPRRFSVAAIPSLVGRTAVVTGANTGIGLDTARELARAGAHVVLACRSAERGTAAVAAIVADTGADALRVEAMVLDLSSIASVRDFAAAYRAKALPLDILVNNAGVMGCPFQRSADGHELQFAINHLGCVSTLPALAGGCGAVASWPC